MARSRTRELSSDSAGSPVKIARYRSPSPLIPLARSPSPTADPHGPQHRMHLSSDSDDSSIDIPLYHSPLPFIPLVRSPSPFVPLDRSRSPTPGADAPLIDPPQHQRRYDIWRTSSTNPAHSSRRQAVASSHSSGDNPSSSDLDSDSSSASEVDFATARTGSDAGSVDGVGDGWGGGLDAGGFDFGGFDFDTGLFDDQDGIGMGAQVNGPAEQLVRAVDVYADYLRSGQAQFVRVDRKRWVLEDFTEELVIRPGRYLHLIAEADPSSVIESLCDCALRDDPSPCLHCQVAHAYFHQFDAAESAALDENPPAAFITHMQHGTLIILSVLKSRDDHHHDGQRVVVAWIGSSTWRCHSCPIGPLNTHWSRCKHCTRGRTFVREVLEIYAEDEGVVEELDERGVSRFPLESLPP